jgi:hypothetical protein
MEPIDESVQEVEPEAEDNTARKWTWRDAVTKADELIKAHHLPSPKRPEGFDAEYEFPTDPATLTNMKLGGIRLMLSAFHGYLLWLIGKEDVELSAFESVYDLILGDAMDKTQRMRDKKLVTDVLRAVTIQEYSGKDGERTLLKLTRAVIERRARVGRLRAQLTVYEAHLSALSREQSRREMEARVGIPG